jgi:putative lipoic acid-binding regulatory protein
MATENSTLEFPCSFPIKAMGRLTDDFQQLVIEIVRRHAPELDENEVRFQDSRNGRYRSVTVVVLADSRDQLDAIYRDLTQDDRVIMAL